jgi:hypothetical protein
MRMTSFSWAKMTSPGCKLISLECHPTEKVNKTGKLTIDNFEYID